ncbi:MAG TPA: hypothetical protein VFO76_06625 [Candidatus Kapabacteria bacterium]|nr:hypothetical protein [Candidatus Kapabacteria bacterium]
MITTTFEAPQVRQAFISSSNTGNESSFREDGFGATTYGAIGYRRLDASTVNEPETLNSILEVRLNILCDKLRAKY